jgi:hypothetical protein
VFASRGYRSQNSPCPSQETRKLGKISSNGFNQLKVAVSKWISDEVIEMSVGDEY